MSNCETFTNMPEGTQWDPYGLLVDPDKRIVYVADHDYSSILMFSFFFFLRSNVTSSAP